MSSILEQFFPASRYTMESYSGHCNQCDTLHSISQGEARQKCRELMHVLDREKRIDLEVLSSQAQPCFSTDVLFGPGRGQMFGVMVCRDLKGALHVLRAFSGQYDGAWEVAGWAPPLFDVGEWRKINDPVEREIKGLGRELSLLQPDDRARNHLLQKRKSLSQQLMKDIHGLYRLTNFQGETRSLYDVYQEGNGIPTGTGDCCAPKLLNLAARQKLTPLGLAEFFWGKENRSLTKHHGIFYPSCEEKCAPILGFLLCGLKRKQ
ncbi:hypothetical protein ACFL6N_04710 [Thermodesulfobacteriota bacterium]